MPSLRLNYFLLRLALLLVGALLASVPVRNETNTNRDGNWWISKEQTVKYSYMVGFFDGIELGEDFSIWGPMTALKDDPAIGKAVASFDNYSAKYMTGVTNTQMVEGLDEFYSDYRNRRIRIAMGVWIVLNEIFGKPKDEMQKMIEGFRKNAVPPSQ